MLWPILDLCCCVCYSSGRFYFFTGVTSPCTMAAQGPGNLWGWIKHWAPHHDNPKACNAITIAFTVFVAGLCSTM